MEVLVALFPYIQHPGGRCTHPSDNKDRCFSWMLFYCKQLDKNVMITFSFDIIIIIIIHLYENGSCGFYLIT